MSYSLSYIKQDSVNNTCYADFCCSIPTSANLVKSELLPALYLKDGDIEVGIILDETERPDNSIEASMITKVKPENSLLLIVKTPDIMMQYLSQGANIRINERHLKHFDSDLDIEKPFRYYTSRLLLSDTCTVVLPEMPPLDVINKIFNVITEVPGDHIIVQNEIKFKYGKDNIPTELPLTAEEYYALISEVHAVPNWDY